MTRLVPIALLTTLLAAAACGDEEEVATAHIRAVVTAATPDSGDARAPEPTASDTPVLTLPNGDTLTVRPSVVAFYEARGYRPAWTDQDEILPRGVSLLEAVGLANAEGLDRERYHFSTAREMARLLAEDAAEERKLEYLGSLDLLLTESFARLSDDLVAGTIDPDAAGLDWRIERGEVDDRALIERVVAGEDPRTVLGSIRPRVPYYDRLVRALARLREIDAQGGWPAVSDGDVLEPGDEDVRVAELRARLMATDDPEESRLAGYGLDSALVFDDSLARALSHFQTRHNLHEDGALGPKSLAALNVPVEDRIEAIRLNLDRWRWLPSDLGDSFILVNIAGFELELVRHDSAIESMNVVVGKTANRTPVFQDTLEYMVVNPYWNVPASIAREEIIPAAARDPDYLARNNYEVVYDGSTVNPASVSPEALRNGSYRIRQKPGLGNALGNVKFLFPNDMDIYLHDTPASHLFSQKSRAFSHGCIRVERPDDLARTLLGELSDRDPSDYDALRSRQGEQWVPLDEKIPVYILYFTAWVDDDGTIRFHEDVYQRDESLRGEQREKLAPVERRPIAADAGL
ncbi:MAG: murein L,D-transpeptidase [Gemmatimonadota bacterium]